MRTLSGKIARRCAAAFSLAFVFVFSQGDSCGHSVDAGDGVVIDAVEINGTTSNPVVGTPATYFAASYTADGDQVENVTYSWTVSDPTILSLDTPAVGQTDVIHVTPLKAGTATLTVRTELLNGATTRTGESMSATKTLSVAAAGAPLTIITTELPDAFVGVPYHHSLTASGGPADAFITWDISGGSLPSGMSLSSTGTITSDALTAAPGTYAFTVRVRAQNAGTQATLETATKDFVMRVLALNSIIITPTGTDVLTAPNTRQYTAKSDAGVDLTAIVSWLSSNTSVATVAPGGLVTAVSGGTANISANLNGVTSSVALTVHAVTSITITPFHTLVPVVGQSAGTFSAVVRDETGADVTSTYPPTWATSNAAVATIVPAGASVAVGTVANGGALITATAGGKSMSSGVTVGTAGAIQFNVAQTPAGGTTVAAYGAQLAEVAGPGRGFVQNNGTNMFGRGYIPGLAPGTYSVTVSKPGYISQTLTGLVVTSGQVTVAPSVTLLPSVPTSMVFVGLTAPTFPATMLVGQTHTYTVELRDASGTAVAIEPGSNVGFAVQISGIASFTLDPNNPLAINVTALAVGTTPIQAFYIRNGQQTNVFTSMSLTVQ